jgi:lipoprotein-releasing system permease protein
LSGAVLRGIDPDMEKRTEKKFDPGLLRKTADMGQEKDPFHAVSGMILGKQLARNLGVRQGDVVYLISDRGMISPIGHIPAMRRFKVVGLFESGMYEYDGSLVYIPLVEAQKILRMKDAVNGIEVQVNDIYNAKKIAEKIVNKLGNPYWTKSWEQMNQNLFSALKLEKTVMFIILTLIVLVAAFNIASTLIMMVMEKTKDIGILKAMGATNKSIRKIFILNGIIIGSLGTFLGVCLGFLLCVLLQHYQFIELPADIYYITTLPVNLQIMDVVGIAFAAVVICYLSTLYPARQASKLNPVEAVRYG